MRQLLPIASLLTALFIVNGCCLPRVNNKPPRRPHVTPLGDSGSANASGSATASGPGTATGVSHAAVAEPLPASSGAASSSVHGGDGVHLELKTEDLSVGRNVVSNGSARIRKYVVTETKSIPVTLKREEFVVERVPASGAPTTVFGEASSTIDLPLTVETATVVITPRVVEVIKVHKVVETEQREISATLRTEKVEVTKHQ